MVIRVVRLRWQSLASGEFGRYASSGGDERRIAFLWTRVCCLVASYDIADWRQTID